MTDKQNDIVKDMQLAAAHFARTDASEDEVDVLYLMVDVACAVHPGKEYPSTTILAAERWVARQMQWFVAEEVVDRETGELFLRQVPDRERARAAQKALEEKGVIIRRDPDTVEYGNVVKAARRVGRGGNPATIWEIARRGDIAFYDPADFEED